MFEINQSMVLNQSHNVNPTCIVVGCKNGNNFSNPSIKYYRVPNLAQSNHIARQWYINTLREDLLDSVNQTYELGQSPIHFVCIEHFDEESFLITKDSSNSNPDEIIMVLKEDAVPSLFEIEVFQKMIVHQEQFALNQQQKLQFNIQTQTQTQESQKMNTFQSRSKSSLLQNLILNIEPQQTISNNNNFNNNSNTYNSNINKRTRIDPDTRAALIQRVPKAVKRTAIVTHKPTPSPAIQTQTQPKLQKALKHTFMKQQNFQTNTSSINQHTKILNDNNLSNTFNNNNNKVQKAVKHTSSLSVVNNLLKDLLPPPIMQSTKRSISNSINSPISTSKAIKHTSPISTTLQTNISQNQQNKQPLTPLVLNSNQNKTSQISNNNNTSSTIGNKITITTTYVYKRVSQQPEIDLQLECEEEELVYIKAPTFQINSKASSKVKTDSSVNKDLNEKNLHDDLDLDKEKNKQDLNATDRLNSESFNNKDKNSSNQIETKESKEEVKFEPKNEQNSKSISTSPIKQHILKDTKQIHTNQTNNEKSKLTAELINSSNLIKNLVNTSNNSNKMTSNNYTNVLAKFYSRRLGAINTALIVDSNNKTKSKTYLPIDLRPGNYPAKCNVCDLILENNIELTSHICSHLESNGDNENNSYISPFDAVTTTCVVCDIKFSQPFHLIKHLDSVHMKKLAEYKCRICEKQHDKLCELIEHLKTTHSYEEMPYRCDACGFRTSFYADAIYHIKKEHTNTLRHFCPYCLKSLVLPFNKKLGHVQCNIFYSHLTTHFNKHENNQMIPSKCKHCSKCILHVRDMKEHLKYDHNSIKTNQNTDNNQDDFDYQDIKQVESSENYSNIQNVLNEKDFKSDEKTNNPKTLDTNLLLDNSQSLRKRKRSLNLNENSVNISLNNELQIKKENYENEPDTSSEKSDAFNEHKLDTNKLDYEKDTKLDKKKKCEISILNCKSGAKLIQKNKRRSSKTSSFNSSEYSNLIKKTQLLKSTKNENEQNTNNNDNLEINVKQESNNDVSDAIKNPIVYRKKQKALKQTNIKPSLHRKRYRRGTINMDMNNMNRSPSSSPTSSSNQIYSTLLFGNIKFSCSKCQFKCVECGETDLKSHYRTDYECHQCKYNTSCSKSFEYHLHGHLVSKRMALWNKALKTSIEDYQCPCGFRINSVIDNNSNANTGNKVAEHLINCEYKYCNYKFIEQNLVKSSKSPMNMQKNNTKNLNISDEIIINDSVEDITLF